MEQDSSLGLENHRVLQGPPQGPGPSPANSPHPILFRAGFLFIDGQGTRQRETRTRKQPGVRCWGLLQLAGLWDTDELVPAPGMGSAVP